MGRKTVQHTNLALVIFQSIFPLPGIPGHLSATALYTNFRGIPITISVLIVPPRYHAEALLLLPLGISTMITKSYLPSV